MEHYSECFQAFQESFRLFELQTNVKKCNQMDRLFRFKLESLMIWSLQDLTSEVTCKNSGTYEGKNLLDSIDFDCDSIEELQLKFESFYNQMAQVRKFDKLFMSTIQSVLAIFECYQKSCCCYECFPDRKLFVFVHSKLFCVYRKKISKGLPIQID